MSKNSQNANIFLSLLTNLQYVLNCGSPSGTCLKLVPPKQRCIWAREHKASLSSPVELQSTNSISSKSLVKQHASCSVLFHTPTSIMCTVKWLAEIIRPNFKIHWSEVADYKKLNIAETLRSYVSAQAYYCISATAVRLRYSWRIRIIHIIHTLTHRRITMKNIQCSAWLM